MRKLRSEVTFPQNGSKRTWEMGVFFRRGSMRIQVNSDRPSAGDVPDAAPVDAPARTRPARLGPRARTVS